MSSVLALQRRARTVPDLVVRHLTTFSSPEPARKPWSSYMNGRFRNVLGSTRRFFTIASAGAMVFWIAACSGGSQADADGGETAGEHTAMERPTEGSTAESSPEHAEGGEARDVVRNGARLVLSFDSESNAFVGTVENTTETTLCAVRVEVHLSTGTELGPTVPVDLLAGQKTSLTLPAEGGVFESFTAHPEISPCREG